MTDEAEATREAVREKYAMAARKASAGGSGCCGPSAEEGCDPVTSDLYGETETAGVPARALEASLGCGNPTALAELREGEVVLDLGSGGGVDVILSARRVGPSGRAYGVDMTDEMLDRARSNAREAGVENTAFLRGEIEDLPLPDDSVDVVISNCVINLSADKQRVLGEAFRVLKPGGRLAVADMVARGALPDAVRRNLELWAGCVAGALEEDEYRELLGEAGFEGIEIEPYRVHEPVDARDFFREAGVEPDEPLEAMEGELASAFVRARRPTGSRRTAS